MSWELVKGITANDVLGKRSLVIGELWSERSRAIASLLRDLAKVVERREITVIDLAPERVRIKDRFVTCNVEGHTEIPEGVRYLRGIGISYPYLKKPEEADKAARENFEIANRLVSEYLNNPTKVLLINEITTLLPSWDATGLTRLIEIPETFVASAHLECLALSGPGDEVRTRELPALVLLFSRSDIVYYVPPRIDLLDIFRSQVI